MRETKSLFVPVAVTLCAIPVCGVIGGVIYLSMLYDRGLLLTWLLLGVPTVAIVGLAWRGHRAQLGMCAAAAGASLAFAWVIFTGGPVGPHRLFGTLDHLAVPSGSVVSREREYGSVICFDYCPSVSRTYKLPVEDAAEFDLVQAFEQSGFRVEVDVTARDLDAYRDGVCVDAPLGAHGEYLTLSARGCDG